MNINNKKQRRQNSMLSPIMTLILQATWIIVGLVGICWWLAAASKVHQVDNIVGIFIITFFVAFIFSLYYIDAERDAFVRKMTALYLSDPAEIPDFAETTRVYDLTWQISYNELPLSKELDGPILQEWFQLQDNKLIWYRLERSGVELHYQKREFVLNEIDMAALHNGMSIEQMGLIYASRLNQPRTLGEQ